METIATVLHFENSEVGLGIQLVTEWTLSLALHIHSPRFTPKFNNKSYCGLDNLGQIQHGKDLRWSNTVYNTNSPKS